MGRNIATGLALLVLLMAPRVHAGDEPSMRVVVRVVSHEDQKLLSRVQGQVADLDVTLVRVDAKSLASSGHARFEQARRLARAEQARIVVWFEAAGRHGRRVHIAEPGRDTLFVRRVATTDASARAEAIAIVVRSSLRALAMGGQIGVKVPQVEAAPQRLVTTPAPRASAPGWRWNIGLHGQLSVDGESSPGQRGFAGRVEIARGALAVGVVAVAGLTSRIEDGMSIVHLARHSTGVSASLRIAGTRRAALRVAADAGAMAYTRSTTILAGGLTATEPSTTWAGFAALTVRGQWRPLAGQPLWLTLEAAGAAVIGAPELRYQLGDTSVVRNQLWPLQPQIGAGVRLEGL